MSFYHYTSDQNLTQIKSSGVLMPSTPHQFSGNLGKGVYVTTMGPNTPYETLRQALFRGGVGYSVREKMEAYVELNRFEIESHYVVKKYEYRESYVIKTDYPILLNKFAWNSGKTGF